MIVAYVLTWMIITFASDNLNVERTWQHVGNPPSQVTFSGTKYFKILPSLPYTTIGPRGKESTEVRKSQIKGKESENSYQELKRS